MVAMVSIIIKAKKRLVKSTVAKTAQCHVDPFPNRLHPHRTAQHILLHLDHHLRSEQFDLYIGPAIRLLLLSYISSIITYPGTSLQLPRA